jgi:hypothetical protein
MSDTIDPKSPKPLTRREALEEHKYERGLWGPEIRATASEPLPDIEETGYHGVLVRETPSNGIEIKHRGLVVSAFTMVVVSLITFYMPFLNALLGGVFGGFFARRWGRAFGAATVASVTVPALIAFFYGFDTPDLLYFLYGLGFWGWTALHVVGMFIGAACGVYSCPVEDRRARPRQVTGG